MNILDFYSNKQQFWRKYLILLEREGASFGYDLKKNGHSLSYLSSFFVSSNGEREKVNEKLCQRFIDEFKQIIIYEERHFMVLFKPPGLLSQLDQTNQPSIIEYGKLYIKITEKKTGNIFFAPVHRLDRPASGLLLIARTSKAARRFFEQFTKGLVKKTYLALVSGNFSQKSGEIEADLSKEKQKTLVSKKNTPKTDTFKTEKTRQGKLYYKEILHDNNCSLLSVQIEGGFFHQIRSMLAFAGHPIVGDYKYNKNDKLKNNDSMNKNKQKMIPLMEREIVFNHPITSIVQHYIFEENEKELFRLWSNIFNY